MKIESVNTLAWNKKLLSVMHVGDNVIIHLHSQGPRHKLYGTVIGFEQMLDGYLYARVQTTETEHDGEHFVYQIHSLDSTEFGVEIL